MIIKLLFVVDISEEEALLVDDARLTRDSGEKKKHEGTIDGGDNERRPTKLDLGDQRPPES